MDLISLLIYLIIVVAICAVAWWGLQQFPVPQPVRILVVCVMVIIVLLLLARMLPVGHLPRLQ